MTTDKLKLLILAADINSSRIISNALARIEDVEIAAAVHSGTIALAKLRRMAVDVILFDIENNDTAGLETLQKMRQSFPNVGVVIVSSIDSSIAAKTIKALEMGALDFVAKPDDDATSMQDFCRQLMIIIGSFRSRLYFQRAQILGRKETPVVSRTDRRFKHKPVRSEMKASTAAPQPVPSNRERYSLLPRIDVVAIGVSTGGPNALIEVIPRIPGNLGVPVFLVQHMPLLFTASLADSLDKRSSLRVQEATDGQEVLPNVVYIAPGGKHMVIRQERGRSASVSRKCIALNDDPPENSCRPSVDVLFRSLAEVYGEHILAIIMTGMGNDGMQGVKAVKGKGGYCLVQTDETCVVYGMPRAVAEAGLSNEMVPLDQIAHRLTATVLGKREK